MEAPSAASRVLNVPELLELILISLTSITDLLRCRRVNHLFHSTIHSSKSLRQALFLEADPSRERTVNPLHPSFFHHQKNGYRDSTIATRIDLVDLWAHSAPAVPALWHRMFISQPPTTTCVIPVGSVATVFFRRVYPDGMTFGDLERAVIAAFEIRKGRRSGTERLRELSESSDSVLIYWR